MTERLQALEKQIVELKRKQTLARNITEAISAYNDNPTDENQASIDRAVNLLEVAQWKDSLEEESQFSEIPPARIRATAAAFDTYLEQPTNENKIEAEAQWGRVVLPLSYPTTTSKTRIRSRISAIFLSLFGSGGLVSEFAIIAPATVPIVGGWPLLGKGGFALVMLILFTATMAIVLSRQETILSETDNATAQTPLTVLKGYRLPMLLIIGATLFQFVPAAVAAASMLNQIVLTPSIVLPAFALVPLGTLVVTVSLTVLLIHQRRLTRPSPLDGRSILYALLVLTSTNVVIAGFLRWLRLSFINIASFPDVVASGATADLPPAIHETALLAHAMMFSSLLLFVACVIVLIEYVIHKKISWFAIGITAIAVLYAGLLATQSNTLFAVKPALTLLGDATFISADIGGNPLTKGLMLLYLAVEFAGLIYIVYLTFRHIRTTAISVFRLAITLTISAFGLLEIYDLMRYSSEGTLSPLAGFPSVEITLAAAIALVALELGIVSTVQTAVSTASSWRMPQQGDTETSE